MEVYCKFKSTKDYDSIPIDWHYTTVSDLKDYILKKKCSGKRNKNHYDNLFVTNADTNEEYLDGENLIPKSTFLIIRRAPRCFCMPIVINPPVTPEQEDNPLVEKKLKEDNCFEEPSTSVYPRESEWVEFWNDLSPSEVVVPVQDAPPSKADAGSKNRDVVKTSALNWGQCHNPTNRFGPGRGFWRGGMSGRGFGGGGLSDRVTPSPGYICHRCKVPGHFIQHCPTNGDRDFDIKRNQPPSGIPNSMLMASPDGSNALPGGGFAVLKPNETAFEKEMQGIPSTRSAAVLPVELHCPLCKAVMKDAVLAGKCCFESFCDKCIRDYIMSNSLCTCGAKNVLADDLIPNRTVRDTIVRILESTKGRRGANSGRVSQPQDMESAPCPQPKFRYSKVPSPTLSEPSKGVLPAPNSGGNTKVEEMTEQPVEADKLVQENLGKVTVRKGVEFPEAAHECVGEPGSHICPPVTDEDMQAKIPCLKVPLPTAFAPPNGIVVATKSEKNTKVKEMLDLVEADNITQKPLGKGTDGEGVEVSETAQECTRGPGSQISPPLTDKEMQLKPIPGEAEKKTKKFTDMQLSTHQDCEDMPVESCGYHSYWNCMNHEFNGFDRHYGQIPFTGYGLGSMSIPFGSAFHHNPFGAQYMMPIRSQRDLAKFGTGSYGELHSQGTTIKQKRDHEKHGGTIEVSRNRDFSRDMIRPEDIPFVKSKFKSISPLDHNHPCPRLERPSPEHCTRDPELTRTSYKRKVKDDDYNSEEYPHQPREKKQFYQQPSESELVSATRLQTCVDTVDLPPPLSKYSTEKSVSDGKRKASVLARITFPEGETAVSKKRKLGNSSPAVNGSSHHRSHRMTSNEYHEDQCNTAVAMSKNIYEYADNHDYDDRHFKRRPSRYETAPVPVVARTRHTSRGRTEKRVIAASISRLSVF